MAEYNPFKDFNPIFTLYKYILPLKVELKDPFDNITDISNWASNILPNGNIVASPNTPEAARTFDTSFMDDMAQTHSELEISKKSKEISLKGSENLSKIIDEVSNEKGFEKLKDPNIKKLILLLAKRESSFNPTVKSKSSSACGYFQFIDGTRKKYSNYSKEEFLKDLKEQVRAAYKYLSDIHKSSSALKLKLRGYNDAFITALGWWYPRSMDMVLEGKKDFSLGGYSIKKAMEDYG